ncbi:MULTISPECIES: DUF3426 domain-containing protein [Luteimonas]|uniref:DUF3426 domain-containing protein n=1 Tax=Luteimonas TaxID=83614 RepID=UPI001E37EDD0|nr:MULTISPECIES: DUF3426 domain-containing protein [Luteimonas]
MFISCRHCRALVATDPVSDLPPLRCPRCRGVLRVEADPPHAPPSVATLLRPADADGSTSAPQTDTTTTGREAHAPAEAPTAAAPSGDASAVADDDLATPSAAPDTGTTGDAAPPAQAAPAAPIVEPDTDLQDVPDATPVAPPPATNMSSATATSPSRPSPSFVRIRSRVAATPDARRQRRWLVAAVVALSLLLALQVLLADRARLARDPGWRPVLLSVCAVLRCAVPPWHEPDALTLLARDVRPDPGTPGQLQVSATFRNDARWPQAWPRLVLTLSDLDGHAIGTRVFAPDEYLAEAPATGVLGAGQSAAIRLAIVEPDVPAVSFAFAFH